ncbi:endolytic transglycosylase MltG [Alkalihalobacterium alkalinitrilicum]|uniref:endolytic transglycosylase MltG n=1 Tax=Alkalihalobacterium alkalinitrilicum TaxID=427920 RepID=UPI00099507F7|nr:endolytic transglycosylase MltG [Alkalihalobacterium alkalinitrilicum]
MDKHTARGLSMGFFITGIVLLLFKSVLAPAQTTAEEPVMSQETIEVFLKANNLMVISEEDYEAMKNGQADESATAEQPTEEKKESESKVEEKEEEKQEEKKEEEKKEDDKPVKHKIKITSGMVSPDVAKMLKEKGLIKDEAKFVRAVESKNAAKYVQIGEHELTTGMSHNEIIQVITKGRAQ